MKKHERKPRPRPSAKVQSNREALRESLRSLTDSFSKVCTAIQDVAFYLERAR